MNFSQSKARKWKKSLEILLEWKQFSFGMISCGAVFIESKGQQAEFCVEEEEMKKKFSLKLFLGVRQKKKKNFFVEN